ncbi:tight adherence protein B [Geodermatophilus bullaregiensis]|uniref:type II secretion system F family protein n=1 Tax=Geodermatophilus bullaregiensis TaxID=1564160 RepID=UPI00195B8C8B|nr:type II secretion system F family protein [Geodermatophilus bullaregiensis]MBM7807176.1 tight adherence protein B [Geodermatophilus bullaregiensis]
MTGALVLVAAAVLLWPGRSVHRRRRLRRLTRAGSARTRWAATVPPPAWPGLAAALAGAGGALLSTPLVAVLAGVLAAGAVRAAVRQRGQRRDDERLDALADALAALGAELRSGRPLEAATGSAVAVCADAESGAALARALRAPGAGPLEARSDLDRALDRVAAAVLLSARTGCSLAAVTGAVEDDLRARRRQRLELCSATAGPRASAALLAGLPLLALAMGSGIGAAPWAVLTTTAAGQVLLVLGVALEAAGLAWSARLVRRALR